MASLHVLPDESTPIYGRDAELAHLTALLDRACDGSGGALVIRGEAGIGKSTLLAAVRREAVDRSMTLLTACGVESESHVPFAGLHQLLTPLLSQVDELAPRHRSSLKAAFGQEDSVPNLFGIALAVLELLGEAAAQAPVVFLLDDAQWVDGPTRDVLAFVARRIDAEPVLGIGAIRIGPGDPLARAGLPQLRLGGLDSTASAALLLAHAPSLADSVREHLLQQAAGNPLALVELPRALVSVGTAFSREMPPLTARLEKAFSAQVEALPDTTRLLLLVGAADMTCGLRQILDAAAQVAGAPVPVDAVGPALDEGLVTIDTAVLRFRHPLVRTAVYRQAATTERLAVHAALAAVLADDPDRHAWHLASATLGSDDNVAGLLERSADRARVRGALAGSVTALERAADLTADPAGRTALLLRAAEQAAQLGQRSSAADLADRGDPSAMGPVERARLMIVEESVRPGDLQDEERLNALIRAAAEVWNAGATDGVRDADTVDLALQLLWRAASRCWWAEASPTSRRAVAQSAQRLGLEPENPRLMAVLAYALPETYGSGVIRLMDRITPDRITPDRADADLMHYLGGTALILGDLHRASSYNDVAAASFRSHGRLALLARTLGAGSWGRIWTGDWDRVHAESHEAGRLAKETGEDFWAVSSLANLSMLAAVRGDHETAEELVAEAQSSPLVKGVGFVICGLQQARGIAAAAAGRHAASFDLLHQVFETDAPGFHEMRWWVVPDLADAAVRTGHRDQARAVLAELERQASRLPSGLHLMSVAYTRAVLADDASAEELFAKALGDTLIGWPWHQARMRLAFGSWLSRGRRHAEARTSLRAARDGFDALGARHLSERARQELHAAGERSAVPLRSAYEALTPQELQIASLAARGLTNRQIAENLFLSHRTVASHMYRIFPKLGITTRTQLAEVLTAGRADVTTREPAPATPAAT